MKVRETKIDEVVVNGKVLTVYYKSGKVGCYMRKEDIPKMMGGVQAMPKTVVNFMRQYPNKVR